MAGENRDETLMRYLSGDLTFEEWNELRKRGSQVKHDKSGPGRKFEKRERASGRLAWSWERYPGDNRRSCGGRWALGRGS